MTKESSELIDGVWALIDNEYVIYHSELKKWIQEKGTPPSCPVCHNTAAGMYNIHEEKNIKKGNCRNCNARLAIIRDD